MAAADPAYLPALAVDNYLPTELRLFAAFALPLAQVRYVLVGEGPYPRAESATGVCFMDGAVKGLWSDEQGGGLSKPVNKATSLRNFMKMLLVADGLLTADNTAGAALTGVALTMPSFRTVPVTSQEVLPVKISAPDLCGRFSGRVIRNLNARAATPEWMKQRLERSGQRSVSALVDISNYVMLELGRPSHVFDLAKIHGGLDVRWGKAGESLKLLNGNTVSVDEWVGVISDDKEIESLAGIMGGDATAVSLDTESIYLEAAFWWPSAIQGRARKYNFSTDAAHRFERGVDHATTVEHIERITSLLVEICGTPATLVGPVDDQIVNVPQAKPVQMRTARAQKVIGVPLTDALVADIFNRLGLQFTLDNGVFSVTAPSYRFDIEIEEDLIEEVARVYGFENIPAVAPV
eukprot:gene40219-49737_t